MSAQQPDPHPDMHGTASDPAGASPAMTWHAMERWLVESMGEMPRAAILDIGPAGGPIDDTEDVECAQIQSLSSETFLLRLSTVVMSAPLLASFSVPRSALDTWFYDDVFDECTHGYLMSRSRRRVAEIGVAWFRDRCGCASPAALGCSYTEPTRLPHTEPR
ncbi:hypothetical protein GTV32_22435 [Gordonia sp. SID5947]|uniref:hypothetical protein n=1 Tax=Gordonia sp. SID5947 TaxID=2690315 RepID=UPI001367F585|nr:hypothetical protein [Gordonia sp. SID5947]MYR08899.1 hypothetical protein [Gordonia sp. SID5947]